MPMATKNKYGIFTTSPSPNWTKLGFNPEMVKSDIPYTTPWSRVAIPRVATSEGTRKRTITKALTVPTARPARSATRMDTQIDTPSDAFRYPVRVSDSPSVPPIERSHSPAIKANMRPSVTTSETAWEPRIVPRLPKVSNSECLMIEKTTTTTMRAVGRPIEVARRENPPPPACFCRLVPLLSARILEFPLAIPIAVNPVTFNDHSAPAPLANREGG